jgi:Ubiquitin carboxyl-terminal hydrolase
VQPGIEECLRMFTAVEILDGENMVGCRRCWKIANGVYTTPRSRDGETPEDESDTENERGDEDEIQEDLYRSNDAQKSPPIDIEPHPAPSIYSSLSASVSSPIISIYHTDRSENVSVSSLPALDSPVSGSSSGLKRYPPPIFLKDDTSSSESHFASNDSPTPSEPVYSPLTARPVVSSISSNTPNVLDTTNALPLEPAHPTFGGGVHIPLISTTAPESPTSPLTARPKDIVDAKQSHLAAPAPKRTPRASHKRPKESDFYDNSYESSGTESDTSTSTSTFDRSESSSPTLASPDLSPRQSEHSKESSRASNKILRSKQVIMRAAYKRYLIGTPPPVLVIHLKRFQQISKAHMMSFSHGFKKMDDYVTFPEYLDLTPFLAPKKEDFGLGRAGKVKLARGKVKELCMYRLYAVVVHIGNMVRYISFALPAVSLIFKFCQR